MNLFFHEGTFLHFTLRTFLHLELFSHKEGGEWDFFQQMQSTTKESHELESQLRQKDDKISKVSLK